MDTLTIQKTGLTSEVVFHYNVAWAERGETVVVVQLKEEPNVCVCRLLLKYCIPTTICIRGMLVIAVIGMPDARHIRI